MDRRPLLSAVALAATLLSLGLLTLPRTHWPVAYGAAALAGAWLYLTQHRLWQRCRSPFRELAEALQLVTLGGLGHKLYGQTAVATDAVRAFNTMSERLAKEFRQLEDEQQQFRAILGGMIEGVVLIDRQQRILFANERAALLLDFQAQAAQERRLWEVVRERPILDVVEAALKSDEPQRAELDARATGKALALYVARLPRTSAQGAIIVLHDTTELRRLEAVQQSFVANVSHELKTPLTIIMTCAETLVDWAADDAKARTEFAQRIYEQSLRLNALIIDLLSLARYESGSQPLELQPLRLADAVGDCLERMRPRADAHQHALGIATDDDDRDLCVLADSGALDTILDNLIDNAIKYTPDGGAIWVRWRALGPDGAILEVEDNGVGIPERDLARVFDRFYRVDKSRSRDVGGTGLGLSIVKQLVQSLRGSVAARSHSGRGTTLTVRLPRVAPVLAGREA